MRFYLDEDLPQELARVARAQGLDVTSSHDVGNNGKSDPEQLDYAAAEDRCLVTANHRDFRHQTDRFAADGRAHRGVLALPPTWSRTSYLRIIRALATCAERRADAENDYLFDFLR